MMGLLGQKKGMTQIFGKDGSAIPVTAIQVGPCTVVQKKEAKRDGYLALQLGYGTIREKKVKSPQKGHFAKQKVGNFRHLREFRLNNTEAYSEGQQLTVELFQIGEQVHVQGVTKGRGFQGVIKRHGKHGGPDAHGSDFHRRPGSIGMRTWPGRVMKNMKLPGRMGSDQVLLKNLEVVGVHPEDHILLVRGSVPGAREGLVVVYKKL